MATSYEQTIYPQALDLFLEVADADTPENTVYARLINKVQNALSAVQRHTVYTAQGLGVETPTLCTLHLRYQLPRDGSGRTFRLTLEVDVGVADGLFGGAPFHRDVALFPSLTTYRIRNNQREYFRSVVALEPPSETGRSCILSCEKAEVAWDKGDVIEAQLLLVKTGVAAAS